jgi:hypothetical protein
MKELTEAATQNFLISRSTENMEYPTKLLDKERLGTIYHLWFY